MANTSLQELELRTPIEFCRKNCKANPNCLNNLGEKLWFGDIKGMINEMSDV